MKPIRLAALFAAATLILSSCIGELTKPYDTSVESAEGPAKASLSDPVLVGNYQVRFDSRTVGQSQTTFQYTILGTGVGPELSHFTIELAACAPPVAGYTPTNGVSINADPTTGLYGIDWHQKVGINSTQSYTVSFPGNVPLGIAKIAIRAGTVRTVAETFAPCANIFDVSGKVFADANADAAAGSGESGIEGVTVELVNSLGDVSAVKSNAQGVYLFEDQFKGTYTVRVPSSTPGVDFNEELFDSFTYTGAAPAAKVVVLTADRSGVDFGFKPQTQKLIDELDSQTLESSAKSVKFWKNEYKVAATGNGRGTISASTLQAYLDQIELLFAPVPFQFDDANELMAAQTILSSNSRDAVDKLRTELLAAELNLVSGNTILNAEGLLPAIVAWGEGVLFAHTTSALLSAPTTSDPDVDEAVSLLTSFNRSGGGGGGGGNE